jgi:hypothetical protein
MYNLKYEIKKNTYYKENNATDFYIELMEGPLTGLCFVYGPITFKGEDEEGNGLIDYDYHLLYIPSTINFEEKKFDIEQAVGQILQKILESAAEDRKDETGTSNTESTDIG